MVLLLSSIIRVNGFTKLSIDGLEGRGAIFGSLFRKGDNDPSGNKKPEGYMVSWGIYGRWGIKSPPYGVAGGVSGKFISMLLF